MDLAADLVHCALMMLLDGGDRDAEMGKVPIRMYRISDSESTRLCFDVVTLRSC